MPVSEEERQEAPESQCGRDLIMNRCGRMLGGSQAFFPLAVPEFTVSAGSPLGVFPLEGHRGWLFLHLSLPPPTLLPGCHPPQACCQTGFINLHCKRHFPASFLPCPVLKKKKQTQPPPRVGIGFSLVITGRDAKVNKNSHEKVQGISENTTSTCRWSSCVP